MDNIHQYYIFTVIRENLYPINSSCTKWMSSWLRRNVMKHLSHNIRHSCMLWKKYFIRLSHSLLLRIILQTISYQTCLYSISLIIDLNNAALLLLIHWIRFFFFFFSKFHLGELWKNYSFRKFWPLCYIF